MNYFFSLYIPQYLFEDTWNISLWSKSSIFEFNWMWSYDAPPPPPPWVPLIGRFLLIDIFTTNRAWLFYILIGLHWMEWYIIGFQSECSEMMCSWIFDGINCGGIDVFETYSAYKKHSLGHSRTSTSLSSNHFCVSLAGCFGSFSSRKINDPWSRGSLLDWSKLSSRISLCFAAFILSSAFTSLSRHAAENDAATTTLLSRDGVFEASRRLIW